MREGLARLSNVLLAALLGVATIFAAPVETLAQSSGPSTGCAQLAAGFFNYSAVPPFSPGDPPDTRTEFLTFSAGETITFNWSGIGDLLVQLNGANVVVGGTSGTETFTVPASGAATLFKRVTRGSGPGSVTSTCNSPTSGPGPTPGSGEATATAVDEMLGDQVSGGPSRDYDFIGLMMRQFRPYFGGSPSMDGKTPSEIQATLGLLWHINYAPQRRAAAPVGAIANVFDFSDGTASGTFPLPSGESDWTFNVLVSGARIDRGSTAANRSTWLGHATLAASHQLDENTVLGFGLKLGGATTTSDTPVATLNSTQLGADLAVARRLAPNLFGGLYAGYELGAHQATVAGVDGSFLSHTLKVGGQLQGVVELDEVDLTPAISAMLSYRHRNGYTDAAAVVVPGSDTLALNGTAGVTVSRSFEMPDAGVVVTPFVGFNVLVDYSATSPAPVAPILPSDTLRGKAGVGVGIAWDTGATASLQASVSRGATTTGYALMGTLRLPIQ